MNKEFLDKKFPEHTPLSGFHDQAYDQRDYLLKQVEWMESYCRGIYEDDSGYVVEWFFPVDSMNSMKGFGEARSSLLAAIESAQKEMKHALK